MKTTLNLDDRIMARAKALAVRQGKTLTEIVETALRRYLAQRPPAPGELPPLPRWDGGVPSVDLSDRDELERAMERP